MRSEGNERPPPGVSIERSKIGPLFHTRSDEYLYAFASLLLPLPGMLEGDVARNEPGAAGRFVLRRRHEATRVTMKFLFIVPRFVEYQGGLGGVLLSTLSRQRR